MRPAFDLSALGLVSDFSLEGIEIRCELLKEVIFAKLQIRKFGGLACRVCIFQILPEPVNRACNLVGEADSKQDNDHSGNEGGEEEDEIHSGTLLPEKQIIGGFRRELLTDAKLLEIIEKNYRGNVKNPRAEKGNKEGPTNHCPLKWGVD